MSLALLAVLRFVIDGSILYGVSSNGRVLWFQQAVFKGSEGF